MELTELAECVTSLSCLVTQSAAGLTIGMLLFLVASGLTLIFGVLGLVNFAHGSFYMMGAYFALAAYGVTESFAAAVLAGIVGAALLGLLGDVMPPLRLPTLRCLRCRRSGLRGAPCVKMETACAGRETCPALLAQTFNHKS